MNLTSGFCFGVCLLCIVSSFRRDADPFSPGRVFTVIWSLAIGLVELKFSRLQEIWPAEVWFQVLLGPLAFLTGIFITYVLNLNTPVLGKDQIRRVWRTRELQADRLFWIVVLLFALYAVAFLIILVIKGTTPPLFSLRPGTARLEFTMWGVGLFLHHVAPIMFLSVVFAVAVRGHRTRKWILAGMTLVSVLTYFTLLQRYQLMMGATMAFGLTYYTTRHIRWSTILPYLLGSVGLFYWVSTLRSAMNLFLVYLYRESKMTFPVAYAWATEPYMYVSMNLEDLARGIARLDHHTYGYYSFNFLVSLSGLKHWIESYFVLDDTPYIVSGYNTYTAFWVYYRDFGDFGLLLLPLIAGLIIGTLYYAMRREPTLDRISLYSLCIFVMLISFFNNPLSLLWFVYSAAITVLAFWLTRTE
jgi:oligosaccharide repeat unit polymerase